MAPYITNDRDYTADEVVYEANDRCNQENLIAQLKNCVCALRAPLGNPCRKRTHLPRKMLVENGPTLCKLL